MSLRLCPQWEFRSKAPDVVRGQSLPKTKSFLISKCLVSKIECFLQNLQVQLINLIATHSKHHVNLRVLFIEYLYIFIANVCIVFFFACIYYVCICVYVVSVYVDMYIYAHIYMYKYIFIFNV